MNIKIRNSLDWIRIGLSLIVIPLLIIVGLIIILSVGCSKDDDWVIGWVAVDNRTLETFTVILDDFQWGKLGPGEIAHILVHKGETRAVELRYVGLDGLTVVSFSVVQEYKRVQIVYKRAGLNTPLVTVVPEMRKRYQYPEGETVAPGLKIDKMKMRK